MIAFAIIFVTQPDLDATVIFLISKAIKEKSIFRDNFVSSTVFGKLEFAYKYLQRLFDNMYIEVSVWPPPSRRLYHNIHFVMKLSVVDQSPTVMYVI